MTSEGHEHVKQPQPANKMKYKTNNLKKIQILGRMDEKKLQNALCGEINRRRIVGIFLSLYSQNFVMTRYSSQKPNLCMMTVS